MADDCADPELFSPRRGSRQRNLSLKAKEYVSTSSRRKRGFKKLNISTATESEDDSNCESSEKPTVLHDNDHVPGDKLFTFQTRKKCEVVQQTPHAFRDKMRKNIVAKILEENGSSGDDFSASESEFEVSEENSEESSSSDDTPPPPQNKNIKPTLGARKVNYTIKTDDYFAQHASKKTLTSNHTLDKLETPRLPQDQLHKLLSRVSLGCEHEKATKKLIETNCAYFDKWMYLMHENFNILLYGLGSKKGVLNAFHEKCLKKLPTVVVNGFFPSLSIKDVLDGIILNLLELKENPSNIYEACDLIEREFSFIPETHLYLIVHNIDMMRSGKAQSVFARLASVNNIHLIASIDHINAPLIWDHSKISKFNFTWWDVTTFQRYIDETSFESSMLVQRTGNLALSSLRNVFLSLTSNSKGIYLILVKYQIENGKKQYYQGLAFKDLYSLCREAFLVSSDLALRAQLTEFVDHKMVKFKRAPDGTEYLIIPIANALLQQFLNEHSG
ncbi:origin recognition complex subunit 2 [Tribolium castaneum]|uniref:origin recognition complex subunit 2 n=1 Tax=Tribolium castaneum TaxID=7070 RepID=UPI0001DCC0ED|nr:PREDICTED: origin recognition complex subunit 2 [Tribolium castaneum]|eukprot:XP_008195282.1 PREDICTED: origin recognition complex subunit 2 [Tribolium castaneum]